MLASEVLAERFELEHLDTADRRGLENLGRLDLGNVVLAARHLLALGWRLVRRRPRVVYLGVSQNRWGYLRDAAFMALARLAGCRIVTHLHGGHFDTFYEGSGRLVRGLIRRTSRWVDVAVVLGDGLRDLYGGILPPERVAVVPNGIPDPFEGGAGPVQADAGRPLRILHLGTLHEPKGFGVLLEAAARLRDEGLRCHWVVAGGWFSERDRRLGSSLMDALDLHGIVEFPGLVRGPEKWSRFRQSELFVFPGYQPEGLPIVILEAMAAGLPVVSTTVGATADAVVDGVTGVLVAPGDRDALAGAVARLASDGGLRRRLGEAGRQRYLGCFTEAHSMEALADVLETACGTVASS